MNVLLVLLIDPALEEDLVDYLLESDHVDGFTSSDASGHGEHGAMTIAEQVTDRRRRKRYEMLIDETAVHHLLGGLGDSVGHGIRYWYTAVGGSGKVE